MDIKFNLNNWLFFFLGGTGEVLRNDFFNVKSKGRSLNGFVHARN